MASAPEVETEEQAEERRQQHQRQQQEWEAEQARLAEERSRDEEQERREHEAEHARKEEQRKTRAATFERILENAPITFTAAQLRVLLRALINLDRYTFDDLADHFAGDGDYTDQTSEEFLLSVIDELPDDKLSGFAVRMALIGHVCIPRKDKIDFLAEAESVFALPAPKKAVKDRKEKKPTLIKANQKQTKKKPAPSKLVAA